MTVINVTGEHIGNGERNSAWGCAIALAILETFPDAEDIDVRHHAFAIQRPDGETDGFRKDIVNFPRGVEDWIHAYDNGESVEPFSFTVNYPPEVTP